MSKWPNRTLSAAEAELFLGGQTMDLFRNQLLICTVNRLGGSVIIPCPEVDATGEWLLDLEINPATRAFTLKTRKKQ